MNNMQIYEQVREVPETAKKPIKGGRISGMTDINPMWRIKKLTEMFGPCGIGWKYIIKDKQFLDGANGEIAAFVDIDLFYREDITGPWNEAVPGTGGSMFVSKEKNGLYVSDECIKMALTDAISVSAKALGIGADVYWNKDETKYGTPNGEADRGVDDFPLSHEQKLTPKEMREYILGKSNSVEKLDGLCVSEFGIGFDGLDNKQTEKLYRFVLTKWAEKAACAST